MHTEQEAREKWCPLARTAIGEDFESGRGMELVTANRAMDYLIPHSCRCIASQCMAWRWEDPRVTTTGADGERKDKGYCGAFGEPK